MNKLDCTISKLINMLVTTDRILKSSRSTVLAVEWTSSKIKSIGKKKAKFAKKQKKKNKPKKEVSSKAEEKKNISIVMLKATEGGIVQNIWRA